MLYRELDADERSRAHATVVAPNETLLGALGEEGTTMVAAARNWFALPLKDESDGTQRFVNLPPMLFQLSAKDSRNVFIVDEPENSMHPRLTEDFIASFLEDLGPDDRRQLILTTHEIQLMRADLLRRDLAGGQGRGSPILPGSLTSLISGSARTPTSCPSTCPAGSAACRGSEPELPPREISVAAKRKSRTIDSRSGRRQVGTQRVREKVRLCVEGPSEEQYLRALLEHRYPGLFTPDFCRRTGKGPDRKTSLHNLLKHARRAEHNATRDDRHLVIWIVCDVDQNDAHRLQLVKWLDESDRHRSALQSVGIGGWIVQHFDKAQRCLTAGEAEQALRSIWPSYTRRVPQVAHRQHRQGLRT